MNQNLLFNFSIKQWQKVGIILWLFAPVFSFAQLSVTIDGITPTCNGYTNGSVTATVSDGTAPYLFSWNGGPATSSNTLSSIGAGTYEVVVTDANNMTASATLTLSEPSAVVVDVSVAGGCAGGNEATANVSGGTGGYTYLWDTGETTATVTGLSAGLHCVTVTDDNGCQDVGCGITVNALSIEMVVGGLACFNFCDASVEAIVMGGTPPYTYAWSNGATGSVNENLGPGVYDVTVTDQAGCTIVGSATVGNPIPITIDIDVTNPPCGSGGTGSATATASGGSSPYLYTWSTGAVGPTISGLVPGTYSVTVTDFLGCTESATATVIEDAGITLDVLSTPSSGCGAEDGTVSVVITGGTGPFDIEWSNGSTASDVLGLAPGTYSVTVTDANGCGASGMTTVAGSTAPDLNIMGVNAGCAANGSASAMVTPGTGTPPYEYEWNIGATTSIINNLTAGTYAVTVTDAEGCTATDQVTVTGSSDIGVSTTVTDVSCFAGSDGSATATVTGATGQVFYMWNNGGMTQTITGLSTGTYFVTVVDNASGCTATINAFVGQPTELEAEATGVDGDCSDLGSAEVSASGGTSPYSYEWSTGETTAAISGLGAGTYTVTVTDDNGCVDEASVTIDISGNLDVNIEIVKLVSNSFGADGQLMATVSGGTQPYDIEWNTGATTEMIGNLEPGEYSVTVTDANGCTGTDIVDLPVASCIGDEVWEDINRNGCQDPGELGYGGITVTLTGTDINGNAVNLVTETLPNGYYLFDNLFAGTYEVHFELPPDYLVSPADACSDDFTDSDPDASGNVTVNLSAAQCNVTVDAGIYDECINITDPGEICCNQKLCGPGNDPDPITSTTPASGGGSSVEYMWMFSTVNVPFNPNFWSAVPGATGASYDPGPLQVTTYFIRCAKDANCDTWYESNSVRIKVEDEAFAEITGPDLVCEGDEATYIATDNGPDATYFWDFGPWATPSTSTEQNPTITWNQAGVVYITLTVTNGDCTSSTEMGVAITNSPIHCGSAIAIQVSEVANAVMISWEVEKVTGEYNFVIQRSVEGAAFENLAVMPQSEAEGLNQYQFMDYFPKKGNAFYRVQVMKHGSVHMYSNVVRIQRFDEQSKFFAYPNPVADLLSIEFGDEDRTPLQLEVLNLQGQLLQLDPIGQDIIRHQVDLSAYRSGTYFFRVQYDDGEREVMRVVKK